MELKGTIEIDETLYRRALEQAFSDYLEDGAQTPESFKEYIIDSLSEEFVLDVTLDKETIAQAVEDTKRFIGETLKNI